jgi:uncharacterized membrane protein YeaQ/YmgE (transglycosylase-associated protein family)
MNTRAFLLATLISGVVMGLLGGLPLISVLNCVLCMWVWLSAILAVMLYRNFEGSKPKVTSGQGALLGLVAGVIGAFIVWLISLLTRNVAMSYISQILSATGTNIPDSLVRTGASIFSLFFDLVLYAIFGAVGGLIGAAIFKGPASSPAPMATTIPPAAPYQAPAPVMPSVVAPEPMQPPQPEPPVETEPPAEEQPPAENP